MVLNIYVYEDFFDIELVMLKVDFLDYGELMMNYVMVLIGVDIVDGQLIKWKVENFWGSKVGEKGYFVMFDVWMDKYCY